MENVNKVETYSSKEKKREKWRKEIRQIIKDNPIMIERLKNA